MSDVIAALRDLTDLTSHGPRFHGGSGISSAASWLESRINQAGLTVTRQPVSLPNWTSGEDATLRVLAPVKREIPVWPMLWSGTSDGPVSGDLQYVGSQGVWGDSITWRRFAVINDDRAIGYVLARDVGPAAPQPLPHGADHSLPHLVVGRVDGLQLCEWIEQLGSIPVVLDSSSSFVDTTATSDNLIVDIPGAGAGHILVCAHYDTFYNTVGAYDNGSGTIALLRLAERWAEHAPVPSIRLVWFTAEEWHLGGSRHYVEAATSAELDRIDFVINLDGLGRGSYLESFAAPEEFGLLADRRIRQYADLTGRSLQTVNRFPPPTGTDDASFYRVGVPSVYFTFNDLQRLHQPGDLPNDGIAENIAWSVGLVCDLLALPAPRRAGRPGIL